MAPATVHIEIDKHRVPIVARVIQHKGEATLILRWPVALDRVLREGDLVKVSLASTCITCEPYEAPQGWVEPQPVEAAAKNAGAPGSESPSGTGSGGEDTAAGGSSEGDPPHTDTGDRGGPGSEDTPTA